MTEFVIRTISGKEYSSNDYRIIVTHSIYRVHDEAPIDQLKPHEYGLILKESKTVVYTLICNSNQHVIKLAGRHLESIERS